MPTVQVDPTLAMYYEDDCFADPWRRPQAVLMIHGIAESSRSWTAWVPHLARDFRVLRVDQRGLGRSTVPPQDYPWSIEGLAADLARFLDAVRLDAVHVVGAKFGGSVAIQFAATYPERTRTLSVLGSPVRRRFHGPGLPPVTTRIMEIGVRGWAAESMPVRLGPDSPPEQVAWWTEFMGSASRDSCIGFTTISAQIDLLDLLPRIIAPTLIVTGEGSSMEKPDGVRDWQQMIPDSELLTIPGGMYHVAAVKPDECARRVLGFIRQRGAAA